MTDLMTAFAEFDESVTVNNVERSKEIDYDKYVGALNQYATDRLGLKDGQYVLLKPVYLHGDKIHSLIFNICKDGKRYSARLKRRISLGIRDREGKRWLSMLKKAYEIAISEPAVGLDPKLVYMKYWRSSNRNHLRMTFGIGDTEMIINAKGIISAHGIKEDLLKIIYELNKRGL